MRRACAFLLLVTTYALRASAGDADSKQRGDEAFDARRYQEAIEHYDAAYAARPDPTLLYNLARAYQRLGDYATALGYFERFIATAPDQTRARVPGLERLVEEVRAHTGIVSVGACAAPCRVRIGTRTLDAAETPARVRVTSGFISIEARREGYSPIAREVQVGSGAEVTFELAWPRKESPPAEPKTGWSRERTIALIATSVGAVGAAVLGTVSVTGANDASDRAAAIRNANPEGCVEDVRTPRCTELGETLDDRDRRSATAAIAFSIAGVLALGTVAVAVLWPEKRPRAAELLMGRATF
jgi:hypothetical protein